MEKLPSVLLWQALRYKPKALFTLHCVNKSLRNKISSDPSHIHWFLEEIFNEKNVRAL